MIYPKNVTTILEVMKNAIEARKADKIVLRGRTMPDGWHWQNESDVRQAFKGSLQLTYDDATVARAFGVAMAECERAGLVIRGNGPGCTSIKLPH